MEDVVSEEEPVEEAIVEEVKPIDLSLEPVTIGEKKKTWSKKKIKGLFKAPKKVVMAKDETKTESNTDADGSMTVSEMNKLRASLGLKPLE
jgi:HIND motif